MQRDDVKAVYAKKMEIHKFIKEPVYEVTVHSNEEYI